MIIPLRIHCVALIGAALAAVAMGQPASAPARSAADVCADFTAHLDALASPAAAAAREAWGWLAEQDPRVGVNSLPDALSALSPEFAAAMQALDAAQFGEAASAFAGLRAAPDPFVAASGEYFELRALAAAGRAEEIRLRLAADAELLKRIDRFTGRGADAALIAAHAELRALESDAALSALGAVTDEQTLPYRLRVAARQIRLEAERRERGTLGEVADLMGYLSDRFAATDVGERVAERGEQVVSLLDQLISEAEQNESSSSSSSSGGQGGQQAQRPERGPPRGESSAPEGSGQIGELGAAQPVNPGEMWGKLPPAERERVLQSLRARFPSRYRDLVEQYYRALAEEQP